MRAYSASSEEALRARNFLQDWTGEGLLTEPQYQRMEQETSVTFAAPISSCGSSCSSLP